MKQININNIDWAKLGSYVAVFLLAFLLFKSCQTNNEVQLTNNALKKEVKNITKKHYRWMIKR